VAVGVRAEQTEFRRPDADSPQTATLYLALFLALLAFFLFLTSLTSFDPSRSMAVIESVDARFSQALPVTAGPEIAQPPFVGPAGQAIVADARFTDAVAGSFASIVRGRDAAAMQAGVPWHGVRLDPRVLFVGETAALNADGRAALEAAAAAMATGANRTDHRIDIAVGGHDALALRRAAVLGAVIAAVNGPAGVSLRTEPQGSAIEFLFFTVQPAGGR